MPVTTPVIEPHVKPGFSLLTEIFGLARKLYADAKTAARKCRQATRAHRLAAKAQTRADAVTAAARYAQTQADGKMDVAHDATATAMEHSVSVAERLGSLRQA